MASVEFFIHPDYEARADEWITARDLYEGKHSVLRSPRYLWPHELETMQSPDAARIRAIREMRSRYLNLIEPVVSRYVSLFFKEEPVISPEVADMFGAEINDVTGTGKSLVSFLKDEVAEALLLYGRPIILTDAPAAQARTLAEERAQGLRPIFRVLPALDCKDWEADAQGFKFLRYEYQEVKPRESAAEKPELITYSKVFTFREGVYRVETFKKQGIKEGVEQWTLAGAPFESAGFPNLPIRSLEDCESWIKDVAAQALKLYNLESTRDSIQYFQAHQRVFFIGVTRDEQKKALAEYTAGFLPEGGDVRTLEPVNTSSIDLNIDRTVANIFRVAFNQNRVAADSAQIQSADAMKEARESVAALIEAEVESIENLINNSIKDYAFFKGYKDFQGKISLSRDINAQDIDKEILILNALRDDIRAVPTWYKETLKKLASYQGLDNYEQVAEEIDNRSAANSSLSTANNARAEILSRLANG